MGENSSAEAYAPALLNKPLEMQMGLPFSPIYCKTARMTICTAKIPRMI